MGFLRIVGLRIAVLKRLDFTKRMGLALEFAGWMHGNRPLHYRNLFFMALLILSVGVNGTQAVVLCMGYDGHIAIEIAGHKHYHYKSEAKGIPQQSNNDANKHDTPNQPCFDVPLSSGITISPVVLETPERVVSVGIDLSVPDIAELGLEAFETEGANPAFISFYDPLSSIILVI